MTSHKCHNLEAWDAAVLDARRLCAAVRRRECRAYIFADGFDNYNNAGLMYEALSGSVTYSTSYRRFAPPSGLPGQGVQFGGGAWVRKNLGRNEQTLVVKLAVLFPSISRASGAFITGLDAGTGQWSLGVYSDGSLVVINGFNNAIQIRTGPGVIASNLWYGIEIEIVTAPTTGTALVWVNGIEVINASGISTQVSSNSYCNQVAIGDVFNHLGTTMEADDFRIWDNTGSSQTGALGIDSRLVTKMPSGAGSFAQMTPNGAAANWQCVDDNPPDDDTTYVSGAASGLTDSYATPSAGFTAAPVMVVSRIRARKDDGSTRTVEFGVISGSSPGIASTVSVGSTYAFYDGCIANDPATSAPWTAAGADAAGHYKQETA